MIGGLILRRAKKALEIGIINKREYNTVLKASSGRITNKNTASQNILLERIKQTEPGTTKSNRKAALSTFTQTMRTAQEQRIEFPHLYRCGHIEGRLTSTSDTPSIRISASL